MDSKQERKHQPAGKYPPAAGGMPLAEFDRFIRDTDRFAAATDKWKLRIAPMLARMNDGQLTFVASRYRRILTQDEVRKLAALGKGVMPESVALNKNIEHGVFMGLSGEDRKAISDPKATIPVLAHDGSLVYVPFSKATKAEVQKAAGQGKILTGNELRAAEKARKEDERAIRARNAEQVGSVEVAPTGKSVVVSSREPSVPPIVVDSTRSTSLSFVETCLRRMSSEREIRAYAGEINALVEKRLRELK